MQVKICYTNKACSETVTEGLKMKYLFFTSSFRNATIKIHICENDTRVCNYKASKSFIYFNALLGKFNRYT